MLVQVKKRIPNAVGKGEFEGRGVQIGLRYWTHDDGPFDVDQKKAIELIRQGLADAVAEMPMATAQKAVAPRAEAQRR